VAKLKGFDRMSINQVSDAPILERCHCSGILNPLSMETMRSWQSSPGSANQAGDGHIRHIRAARRCINWGLKQRHELL
jgi:hypothetical protein